MPGYGELHQHGRGHEGLPGSGFVLVLLGITALLAYQFVTSDPTQGLDYASGDQPTEMKRSICFSDSGPCPPTGFAWTIPESGAVRTRFEREEIDDRTALGGSFRLRSSMVVQGEVRDCPTVVEWSLLADDKPVAQGTVTAGGEDREVGGVAPEDARSLVLTARRTDSETCRATLQWLYAGLH